MNKYLLKPKNSFQLVMLGLFLLLFISVTIAVSLGPVSIGFGTIWRIIFAKVPFLGEGIEPMWTQGQYQIIWNIRLPRVILGFIVGAGLSVVGIAMQALVRNSLADPYILGVSSGASVGATLVIVLGLFNALGQYALAISAFFGALISVVLVFLLAQISGRVSPIRLLLAGIALSAILNSVTSFIVLSAPRTEGIRNAMFWMMGGLAGTKWHYLIIPALAVVIGVSYLYLNSRQLNAMLMGEETAETLGVNTDLFSKSLLIVTALITGVIVAVSGAIGFVGLMIPHIVRMMVGSNHSRVIPISALVGGIFIIWADVVARLVLAPQELPIGIVTSICGGPFFIWLLRKSSYSFGGGK